MKRSAAVLALLAAPLLFALACREPEPEPTPVSTRIENPALELALASVPEPFAVAENSRSTLRFRATRETGGDVVVRVGEPEYGLNLVAAVQRQGDAFRAMAGGEYHGSRELGTPSGPAFYARGSYDAAGGVREEQTWIFGLHPGGESRLLSLTYTYPAGEGQTRVNDLLALLGEIEFLPPAIEPAAVSDPEADAS